MIPQDAWAPIRAKYRGRRNEAINKAIRAECPGGSLALDAMTLTKQACDRHGWRDPDGKPSILAALYDRLVGIADAMEDDVRVRWRLPPRQPT